MRAISIKKYSVANERFWSSYLYVSALHLHNSIHRVCLVFYRLISFVWQLCCWSIDLINVCQYIVFMSAHTHLRTHTHTAYTRSLRYVNTHGIHPNRILNENCVIAFYIWKKNVYTYRTIFSLCLDLLSDLLFLCLLFICSSSFHFALLSIYPHIYWIFPFTLCFRNIWNWFGRLVNALIES